MTTFPQLSTGAITQFPFRARVRFRSSRHEGSGGGEFSYEDPDFEERAWDVELSELSDSEWSALEQLFQNAGGSLGGFTFLDPTANLLAWSEAFDEETWSNVGAGLTVAGAAPPSYRYAGSIWARTTGAGASMRVSDGQGLQAVVSFQADGGWRRYVVAYPGFGAGDSVQFELSVPAASSLDVFGPQLEAQAAASEYKHSGKQSGVHPNARFDQDILSDRSPGPNRHSTRLRIVWTPSLA